MVRVFYIDETIQEGRPILAATFKWLHHAELFVQTATRLGHGHYEIWIKQWVNIT